ncbi:MAG TPA: dTMP kinase [Terriglobia bacterium]|nr:dTMP kinase [Terriglobia bacterium]
MTKSAPVFISFEGIDGCGKTTQIHLLERSLRMRRIPVVVAREPGGTPLGESIRRILLDSSTTHLEPISELLLYYASRHQNLTETILPALENGNWVLCDRYADASMAYQGYGRGIDLMTIEALNRISINCRMPDLTILIDVDPGLSLARARDRNSHRKVDEGRFEKEPLEFYNRVRQGYMKMAQKESSRFRIVDGNQSIDQVHQEILRIMDPLTEGYRAV